MWRNLLVNQLIFIARYQVHSGITLCSASFAFTLCPTPLLSTQTLQPHTEHAEADSSIVQLQVYIYWSVVVVVFVVSFRRKLWQVSVICCLN